MQQQKVHYPLGAHLIVKHFGYTHHGIYAGRGRVIQNSGFAHLFKEPRLKSLPSRTLAMDAKLQSNEVPRSQI